MTDVTQQITEHLMAAAKLAVSASGSRAGKYAVIAQITVGTDGSIILSWDRYGPD